MARHVEAMVGFMDGGAETFDYGNSIRDEARLGGYDRAFAFPGFVPAYIRPLFCEGKGPFRWAALSGDPRDIAATDEAVLRLFPDNDRLHRWMRGAQERIAFQGLDVYKRQDDLKVIEARNFVASILDGQPHGATIDDAVASAAALDAMTASVASGRWELVS